MKKLLLIMLLACSWMGWGQAGTKPVLKGAIWVAQATPPASPSLNEVYRATDGILRRWNGSSWVVDSGATAWSALTGVPAGFADGIDNDTQLNNAQVETAYNAQVAVVTQPIAELGTSTIVYRWTPERIKQAILALAPAGSSGHTIQDEGVAETARTNLNFVGAQVNVTDDAGNDATIVTITGDGTGTDDQVAAEVPMTPVGGVAASNVQAGIQELDTEKMATATLAASGGAALVGIADAGGNFDATTVEGALAEIVDFAPTEITANTTLTAAHLNRILWNDSGGELEVTVPSTIGVDGDFIYLMAKTTNSALKPIAGAGTVLQNLYKTAAAEGSVLKYVKINGSWLATGDTYAHAVMYTIATNYYTLANAANPDSEVNATTGYTANTGSPVMTSIAGGAQNGSYYLQLANGTTGTANNGWLSISGLAANTTYTITMYLHEPVASSAWNVIFPTWGAWAAGQTGTNDISTSAFTQYTFTVTTDGTTNPRYIVFQSDSGAATGKLLKIDNITITN